MKKVSISHSSSKTLDEWLSYIESIHFTEIDIGLTRIKQVAERLTLDLSSAKVITVAGTNGKGTTCAFIENYLHHQGLSVGVYSSPHIEQFNERLRINKSNVEDEPLIKAFETIENARLDISLSYYEYTTLAALMICCELKLSYIILEVGLGGRLDATNIVDCDFAVLTTIDLDHQAFLGNTREKIGFEKSGIMRKNAVAVIGDKKPPQSVIDYANKIKTKSFFRNKDFSLTQYHSHWTFHLNNKNLKQLQMPHIPIDNVATALTVLSLLPVSLNESAINQTIALTKVPGRLELFTKECDVILDVGHNPQAARYLALQVSSMNYKRIFAVTGMLIDKDIENALAPLINYVEHWYIGSLHVNRGATAQQVAEKLPLTDESFNCFDNVNEAFKMASSKANSDDLILVYGSFYTVSEIRRSLI